ncbi:DUF4350 domain-containing protein [Halobacterium salinarum]|uniref:DUF4350 domain-containing protein n=1 Tax=Halobacterium salinarum TaxID=2242 RepID=UPI002556877A|nr:DUF4350 domain-containing protein [Halobacterium salinarum]MDL0125593.1 DUF4350 domain-containing protein [Halobacterium salinarum]
MRVRGYEITYPRILLAVLVVTIVTAGGVGLSTSSTAFDTYNPGWDGTSELRDVAAANASVEIEQSTVAYTQQSPNTTTAFIISPTTSYAGTDDERIASFLSQGGTVVVASDFDSHTNPLLAQLGVETRFNQQLVRDERHYFRGPDLPVATNISSTPLLENVSRLTLNHGTTLTPGPNSTTLATTSEFAYLDANQNGSLDANESLSERPVVVRESYGSGAVILVSDPSIFINSMLDAPDNRRFAKNLAADADTVVFDYSHRTGIPLAVGIVLSIADSPLLQFLVITVLVGVCATAWTRRGLTLWWRDPSPAADLTDPGLSHTEITARITARHPEWDDDRIERVARGIMSDESNEGKE